MRQMVGPRLLTLSCVALFAASCGGTGPLAEGIRPDAVASVRLVGESTGIVLNDVDATCTADSLGDETAQALIDAGTTPSAEQVALVLDEAIACVGSTQIAMSAIAPQVPTASEESLECAANEFDSDLLVILITGVDDEDPTLGSRLELELASSLAECLTPEELLDLGG